MKAVYKVPDGKMIKINLSIDNEQISDIRITGDFFLHPEDTLQKIELKLIGINLSSKKITDAITQVLETTNSTLIGAKAQDFAHAILLAKENQ